jgi:AcrR family transcriptional regulator
MGNTVSVDTKLPTETRLLDAAFELFLNQGYHGSSMRQVASRAGITPGSIYNHFESKEALFVALLTERVPHRAIIGALAHAEGETVEAIVQDSLRRMVVAAADQFDNFRLMFIELIEFQGRHAGTIADIFFPQLLAFIERLKGADSRLRSMPPVLLARAFFGLFFSYVLTATLLRGVEGFDVAQQDVSQLGEIFLFGVLEKGP